MKVYRRRAYIMTMLTLSLVIPGVSAAQSNQGSGHGISQIDSATSGVHDFDFLAGHWRVHHRKLKKRLAKSHEWIEFEGTLSSQPLMGGYSNVERPHARCAGRSLSWRSAAILRLEDPTVVNLVARQSDATGPSGSTHERDLQGRRGNVLRG